MKINTWTPRGLQRRMALWISLLVIAGLVVLGVSERSMIGMNKSVVSQDANTQASVPYGESQNLKNPLLAHRAEQIVSTFENSILTIVYDNAENINDGRGITAGRAGFTSGTGDLLEVVKKYSVYKPSNPLIKYLPALTQDNRTDSIAGLENFPADWKHAVDTDPALVKAQNDVYDDLYFKPALKMAQSAGVTTGVGQLIILDTIIQHGEGNDPDGLPAIIHKTVAQVGNIKGNEQAWLKIFLAKRRAVLQDPSDKSTTAAWRESVPRVDALLSILNSNNPTLSHTINWKVYGDTYSLPSVSL
jgi:chitosanase